MLVKGVLNHFNTTEYMMLCFRLRIFKGVQVKSVDDGAALILLYTIRSRVLYLLPKALDDVEAGAGGWFEASDGIQRDGCEMCVIFKLPSPLSASPKQ